MDTIASRLRFARELAGLRPTALAADSDLSSGHVFMIEGLSEHTIAEPRAATLAKLVTGLSKHLDGVTLAWLRDGTGEPPTRREPSGVHAMPTDEAADGTEGR